MVDVGREGQFAAGLGDDVTCKTFSIEHHFAVQTISRAVGAGFCENVACTGIIFLNFCERAVFAEDRQRVEKNVVVGARSPVGEIVAHEIRSKEVGPITSCAVAL